MPKFLERLGFTAVDRAEVPELVRSLPGLAGATVPLFEARPRPDGAKRAEQQALPEDAVGAAHGARAEGAQMSRFRRLRRGRVYTTEEVGGPKMAQLMIFAGWFELLGKGLYWASPDRNVGKTRPSDLEILSVLLRGKAFLVSGNERWDALGLGVTKPLGKLLVYTLRRKGENVIGGRRFWFVRVYKGVRRFPTGPVREWWIIDLLENLELAGLERDAVLASLSAALIEGRFNREVLVDQATRGLA